ncbi:MAG: hypothetical protein WHS88_00010 [Anaerohalosphaeraceae bacterium]
MKKNAFFVLSVFTVLCGICAGRVADGWKITQITNRDFIDYYYPIVMSGNNLAWVEFHPEGYQIVFSDRSSVIQVSSGSGIDPWRGFSLSGGSLVWVQNSQIMFWNGSGPVQISSGTGFCTNPKISGNNVVWAETVDFLNAQIFFWNGGTPTQISSGSGISYYEFLGISGGNVVWVQNGQIMFWNGGSPMAISTGDGPKISGSRVVWLESGLLMCWNGVSAAPIPESENAYLYDISETLVVWCSDWHVKAWDGSETRTLWKGYKNREHPPAVSGSQLVWEEWASDVLESSYMSLHYSDSHNGILLTDMPGCSRPVISGTDVAFLALDEDYKWQIFLAQPETAAPFQPLSADINKDNIVDLADLSILASQWLGVSKERFLYFSLNTNPGWTCQGQWAFGRPLGGGGTRHGFPDPVKGNTGSSVYGVNLSGDYSVAVGGPYYLTAGPFDCSAYEKTELQFARWLNSDEAGYVRCTVEVSTNGTDWFVIWTNAEGQEHTENQWQTVAYDISSIADGQSAVLIRWGYQIRDKRAWPYSGWNIDDIALYGQKTL